LIAFFAGLIAMRSLVSLSFALLFLGVASSARADLELSATLKSINTPNAFPGMRSPEYVVRIDWKQNQLLGQYFPGIDQNFSSFCIELNQNVYFGGTYTFKVKSLEDAPVGINDASPHMTTTMADQLRRLWYVDRGGLGDDNIKNAAFQMAIWKILGYSGIPNLNNAAVDALTLQYIADSQTAGKKANLVALTNSYFQDQIVEMPPDSPGVAFHFPLPPGFVMGMTGIIPLVLVRRGRLLQRFFI